MAAQEILIVGASSFIGRHLLKRLGPDRAYGTYHTRPFSAGWKLNLTGGSTWELPSTASHAVIAASETNLEKTENMDAIAEGTIELIKDLWNRGTIPIFLSSEYVFDGHRGGYTEEDVPDPILEYGRQKRRVEQFLSSSLHPHVILRLAKVYGTSMADQNWLTRMVHEIANTTAPMYAVDQAFSPVLVDDVVTAIIKVIESDLNGTYHLCGDMRHTRFEIAGLISRDFEFGAKMSPISIRDLPLDNRYPRDVSMRNDLIKQELDVSFRPIRPAIYDLVAEYKRRVAA